MHKVVGYRQFFQRVLLLGAVFLILYLIFAGRLQTQQEEENALRMTLIRLEDENKDMEARLKLVDTEDYIVTSAMTNYSFMNKNDLRFQFTNPEALYAYTENELKILMDEMAD